MRCVRCEHENRPGRSFCSDCGARLPAFCAACGYTNGSAEKFCGGCGAAGPFSARQDHASAPVHVERRPVAILFADLAGYARLSNSLESEEMHRLLERFFELADGVVLRHGGSIDKHVGDAVMAIFGAPVAHGNDEERAVRAALDLHVAADELSRDLPLWLRLHVGVASGEAMASSTGSSQHQQYSVTSDAVTLVARLRERATAGETMVSEAVSVATQHLAIFERVGEIAFRAAAEPTSVWKVVGLRAARGRRTRAFVGRRSELRHIRAVLEGCVDEARGSAICVRGEAGLGKTRLLGEVRAVAAHLGFRTHQAVVADFGAGAACGAIQRLALGLLGLSDSSAEAERREAVSRAVAADILAPEHAPFVRELLNVPLGRQEAPRDAELEHAARAALRIEALAQLVDRLSRRTPLLLSIEDIHWADRMTLNFLGRLAALVGQCRAVLLLTTRVDGDPLGERFRTQTGQSSLFRIDLGPLREEEAYALASELAGSVDDLTRRCIARAAGNPLFLEQLLASERDDSRLPASVSALVLSRIDRLPGSEKAALEAASVLGQRFELEALVAMHETARDDCVELARRQLLLADEHLLAFHHTLVREAVYASLTGLRREELHAAAARWYQGRDAVLYAEHLELAGQPAAPAFMKAAEELAASYHYERASVLLKHALQLSQDATEIHALASLRGKIESDGGAPNLAVQAYERAFSVAGSDQERCAALIGLANAHRQLSNYEPLLGALERAEPIALALDLASARAKIHYLRGSACFALGRREACLREHEQALQQALRFGDAEWQARAQSGLGDAYYALGRVARSGVHYLRCIEICEQHGYERLAGPSRVMLSFSFMFAGDFGAAMAAARRALASVERTRDTATMIVAHHALAMTQLLQAKYSAARREAALSLEAAERSGTRRFEATGMVLAALSDDGLGRTDQAEQLLDAAIVSAREAGFAYCGPMALAALAAVTHDPAKGRAALAEGERIVEAGTLADNALWFSLLALRFAVRQHDRGLLRRYADWLLDFARRDALTVCELAARGAELELAVGDAPADESLAARRLEVHERAARLGFSLSLALGPASNRAAPR